MDQLMTTHSDTVQYIVIKIGQEQYGIDIRHIDNIVRMQHITRVPKVQEYLKGVINLRGEVIPVMSIRTKMGYDDIESNEETRIIIVKLEQHGTVGIIVDEVKEVVTLSDDEVEHMTSNNKQDDKNTFLQGVGKYNNQLISLLDLNAVLTEKE